MAQFEELCVSCHMPNGNGTFGAAGTEFYFNVNDFDEDIAAGFMPAPFPEPGTYDETPEGLSAYIRATMPWLAADTACSDTCADDTAAYLWSLRAND